MVFTGDGQGINGTGGYAFRIKGGNRVEKAKIILTAIVSSVLIVGGIFLAANPIMIIGVFARVLGILLTIFGSVRILFFLFVRDNAPHITASTIVIGLITLGCGIFLLAYPGVIDQVVRITLAVWLFFSGGVSLLTAYSYHANDEKKWVPALIWGILLMAAFLALLTAQELWVFVLSTFVAAYCIMLGFTALLRLFMIVNQKNKKRKNIPLPFFVEAALPKATLEWVKSTFEGDADESDGEVVTSGNIPKGPTDIEILVHLSDIGTNALGHVDLVVDGQVFSYGNYDHDPKQTRLFGLFWDGVFAVCGREKYIKFSLDSARKTIIGYELQLSGEDEERVKANIADFLKDCEPWEPQEPQKNGYARALARQGAKLFKVKQGKYKTYFMLNTNCALLLEDFLAGTSIPKARVFGGVMTPGALLSMYENELKRPGSPVVGRTLYVSERMASAQKKKTHEGLLDLKDFIQHELEERKIKKHPD